MTRHSGARLLAGGVHTVLCGAELPRSVRLAHAQTLLACMPACLFMYCQTMCRVCIALDCSPLPCCLLSRAAPAPQRSEVKVSNKKVRSEAQEIYKEAQW